MIQLVEIADQILLLEWVFRFLISSVMLAELLVQALPLLVVGLAIFLVLLYRVLLILVSIHTEGLFECEGVNLLKDGFQGDQRLLENLVPMLVSQFCDNWDKHGEGLVLIGLEDVQEVVILKETHGAISYLQVNAADTLDNTLEQAGD